METAKFLPREIKLLEEVQKSFPSIKFTLEENGDFSSIIQVKLESGYSKGIMIDIRYIPEELSQLNLTDEDIVLFAVSSLKKQILKVVEEDIKINKKN